MSRSAFSLVTSRRSRSISNCSGFICPWPGKACTGSEPNSFTHLRNTFSWTPRSRPACATDTPRSLTSLTASTLNSRLNFRLCMTYLRLHETPNLGVHQTVSSSVSIKPAAAQCPSNRQQLTSKEDVDALLAGVSPHLMVTDPPYGVSYDPSWRK